MLSVSPADFFVSLYSFAPKITPTETLIRLADFYSVSIDYILCCTDNPELNK